MKFLTLGIMLSLLFVGYNSICCAKTVRYEEPAWRQQQHKVVADPKPKSKPIAYEKVTSYKKVSVGEETFSLFEVKGMKCLHKLNKHRSYIDSPPALYSVNIPSEVLSCVPNK